MTEEQAAPQSAPEPAEPTPAPAPAGGGSAEVEEGKVFAILSYALGIICIPFFLVPLIMRNNEFSLYHAKQCLVLALIVMIANALLWVTCVGPIVVSIAMIVMMIIGLINAINGEQKPLPLIGKWGEDWFKGLKKV